MNTQINLRLPDTLLVPAQKYAKKHGYGTIQDFIKETIREKLFDESLITKEELSLVRNLVKVAEENKLYGTEKDLMNKLG